MPVILARIPSGFFQVELILQQQASLQQDCLRVQTEDPRRDKQPQFGAAVHLPEANRFKSDFLGGRGTEGSGQVQEVDVLRPHGVEIRHARADDVR